MTLLQRQQQMARLRTLRIIQEAGRLVLKTPVYCERELPASHRILPRTVMS